MFPKDFIWGAATSAYQVEGSPTADGAGASIWQRFSHTAGNVLNNDTGDVACDHYRRYRDDVGLMRELGLQSYRFSIAWGRVLPEGTGRVNQAGLDFYDRLVDELLASNIVPNATLYHWDLPEVLDNRGGWLNRDIAEWFADYARVMFEKLDDRVKFWSTLNEPWVVSECGYLAGVMAPGHKNKYEAPIASHNLLRAHGRAVQVYREIGKHQIGLVVNIEPKYPASNKPEDIKATARQDAYMNRQYLDPVLLGQYPDEMSEIFDDEAWVQPTAEDMALIAQPIDFIGVNYYTRGVFENDVKHPPEHVTRAQRVAQPNVTHTEMGWEVNPQAFLDMMRWIKTRYNNPDLYITENGSAFYDAPEAVDGVVNDPLRVNYQQTHLRAVREAIDDGCNVKGYYAWSLLDNMEWHYGYSKRFGIIHVNFKTQERTIKASGHHYKNVIATNGGCLG